MGQGIVRAAGAALSVVTAFAGQGAAAQLAPAVVQAPPTVAAVQALPAVLIEDAEPVLPAGGSPNFVPPAHDANGYDTPNRNLSPEEKTWHVRVALNVAALGCRGAEASEVVASYNALLTNGKAVLAAASNAMGARYKARYGTAWQARHDDAMTKLYNFWALPPVQSKFCGVALEVLREASAIDPAAFPVFAGAVLPRLEAPLVAYFAEFEAYVAAREAWRTRRARAMIAAAVPAGPVAAGDVQAAAVQSATVQTAAVGTPVVVVVPASVPAAPRIGPGEP